MATQTEDTTTTNADNGQQPKQEQATTAVAPAQRETPARAMPLGPFAFIRQLFDDLAQMWGENASQRHRQRAGVAYVPDIEISHRDGKLIVKCDLPGISPDDVEVSATDGMLVITGERRSEHEVQDAHTWRCERTYGAFRREIPLPDGADAGSAEAHFDKGVLEVTMTAREVESQARKIEIQHGETLHH